MRRVTSITRLRLVLGVFFLALAVPTVILVQQAYSQLKWEAFYQYRNLAQELSARIDGQLNRLISAEEARSSAAYSFLVVSGALQANYLQPSPLSAFPVDGEIPGLIGYFQLAGEGGFSTPLLPQPPQQALAYGVSAAELSARLQLQQQIQRILGENQLVQPRLLAEQDRPLADDSSPQERKASTVPARTREDRAEQSAAVAIGEMVLAEAAQTPVASQDAGQAQEGYPAGFERLIDKQSPERQQQKLDALSEYGRVADLQLGSRREEAESSSLRAPAATKNRAARKEQGALPIVQAPTAPQAQDYDELAAAPAGQASIEITLFESEIDPFDFALLDSGHFVIYRNVWRDGQRSIQGAIIDQQAFLRDVIEPLFRGTGLAQMSDLAVAYQGNVFAAYGGVSGSDYLSRSSAGGAAGTGGGELLYQSRLSAPFGDLQLFYSIKHLPPGRGATVLGWAALVLAIVLLGGLWLMYRLGLHQLALAQQQQDFVSAVSHELKTPLTSIRMYSEILREGWAEPEKRKGYYDFIFEESERLSRLISNVLQLARMNRREIQPDLKPVAIQSLFDAIGPKLSSLCDSAGVDLNLAIQPPAGAAIAAVDTDCLTQILINLVDNAIKFSARATTRSVDVSVRLLDAERVVIAVRDYGPGVPKNQMKKIFQLFYRSETELTRETVGTGIGLALVHQQVQAMGGKVDVVNREPGAEFSITLAVG